MTLVIFGIGVLVFFLTVYGTVIAGGLQLTKEQMRTNPDLAPKKGGGSGNPEDDLPTRDIIRADF
jgi:hypothetical protein|tara:strand:- start:2854 stop:3048 length:195 start_codon:yes stop_codon:yes gene_type:complete